MVCWLGLDTVSVVALLRRKARAAERGENVGGRIVWRVAYGFVACGAVVCLVFVSVVLGLRAAGPQPSAGESSAEDVAGAKLVGESPAALLSEDPANRGKPLTAQQLSRMVSLEHPQGWVSLWSYRPDAGRPDFAYQYLAGDQETGEVLLYRSIVPARFIHMDYAAQNQRLSDIRQEMITNPGLIFAASEPEIAGCVAGDIVQDSYLNQTSSGRPYLEHAYFCEFDGAATSYGAARVFVARNGTAHLLHVQVPHRADAAVDLLPGEIVSEFVAPE